MDELNVPEGDFALGEWQVRPSLREISGPAGSIRLEPKVMDVLVYLAWRAGETVTKEELLDAVWKDTFVADGALFRHVSELRRHLGDDLKEPRYIQTIPKRGYRLLAPVSREEEAPAVREDTPRPPAEMTVAAPAIPVTPAAAPQAPPPAVRLQRRTWFAFAVLAVLAAISSVPRWPYRSGSPTSSRPNIAVLYFENLSGDPSLDWLRVALTDMLVTDLSQSPRLDVLGTDRLYQILKDSKRLDDRVNSPELTRQVADKTSAEGVVLGSFVKSGDTIRITARLQDPRSGQVLMSEKVDVTAGTQLFSKVDELTGRIRARFDPRPVTELDRDLKDITTSSVEAYRYYVEGINLHTRYKEDEAQLLFKKAVDIDPGFAMALAKLSVVHFNLGQMRESEEYAQRALQHLDRLTVRERYTIEGWSAVRREDTMGRAETAYRKLLELYPNHATARNNLGAVYSTYERFEDAIPPLEQLRRQGFPGFMPYKNLAKCYTGLGRFDQAQEVLLEFRQREPDNPSVHRSLAFLFFAWGRFDEALKVMAKAEELEPADFGPETMRLEVARLRDQWEPALASTSKLTASGDDYWTWTGLVLRAEIFLYHGRSQDAVAELDRASTSRPGGDTYTSLSRAAAARTLLAAGLPQRALQEAERAQKEGAGNLGEWEGLLVAGLAQEALGNHQEADRTQVTLRRKAELMPSDKEKRRAHHLAGELALARGDSRRALEELQAARSTLPAYGNLAATEPSQHVPIWFSLGSAYLAAGDTVKAAEWLEKLVTSGPARLHFPIPYVRSFYLLGRIHEGRGDIEKARLAYRRFADLWGAGDLDREHVTEAARKAH